MIYIGTTRYNSTTLAERNKWLKKKNWDGCVYGLDKKLPETIPDYQWCYIIEMVNDINQIAGIGYIKNEYCPLFRSRIYTEEHYNMHVYKGKKYIPRNKLLKKYPKTIEYLEQILFKDISKTNLGAVTNVSDHYTIFNLTGSNIFEILSKGSPFNFDSEIFGDNKVIQTILNHVDVTIHRKSKEDVDLYVRRSFSDHLWAWIKDSSRFI